MPTVYYGETTRRPFALGPVIGCGGVETVYAVAGADHPALKVPDEKKVNLPEALERIRHFAADPLGWPAVGDLEVVLDAPGGKAVGFVMRRVVNAHTLECYLDEAGRTRAGIRLSHPEVVRLTARVAEGLAVLHDAGVVEVGEHDGQVLVDPAGEPHFLEPDGWEFGLRRNGVYRWLRSGVGVYEYAPPELQGVEFSKVDRSVLTDRWALGALVKGGAYPHQVKDGSVCTPAPTDLAQDKVFPHDPKATLPDGIQPVDDPPAFVSLPADLQACS